MNEENKIEYLEKRVEQLTKTIIYLINILHFEDILKDDFFNIVADTIVKDMSDKDVNIFQPFTMDTLELIYKKNSSDK